MKEENKPDFIKFDEAIDEMIEYCEEECNKKQCIFGYDKCPI